MAGRDTGVQGVSPRKAMAGATSGGNFGVESYHSVHGGMGTHPDATARTGAKPSMADGDRGIGMPIKHSKEHHPAQAAPDHGPGHAGGYGNHHGGKY